MTSRLSSPPLGEAAFTWIKARERWLLLAAVVLQAAVLLGMIVPRSALLAGGQTIYVRVIPVDPRDFMRGDYVILGYEFSTVPNLDGGMRDWEQLQGRDVYAHLVPEGDGKHWRADRFSLEKPKGGPVLRGRLNRFGRVEYGIEQFFVQEGKGHKYEDAMRSRRLTAE